MSYNTGNPVPSTDARDLSDNAEKLDLAVNSENDTFVDRTGQTRLTLKGMEQVFDGGQPAIDAYYNAVEEADRAEAEAGLAETARDAAFVNADVYEDIASGLAAVADGEQFQVAIGNDLVRYRRDSAMSQTEMARYSSASHIRQIDASVSGLASDHGGRLSVIENALQPSSILPVNQLLGDELVAVACDATTAEARLVDGVSVTAGDIDDCIPVSFGLKLVTTEDGSLRYNPHNYFLHSGDLSQSEWLKGSVTVEQNAISSGGGSNAWKITATGTNHANVRQALGVSSFRRDQWFTVSAILGRGSATRAFVDVMEGATPLRVYFDLIQGTVGTADAALDAAIYDTRVDGTRLPGGHYRIAVSTRIDELSTTVYLGPCDADGSVDVTVGRSISVESLAFHYGKVPLPYYVTAGSIYHAPPYDWSRGERTLHLEDATTYNSQHSDDLTQSAWAKSGTSAALDDTGPHGEPCSTLTATAADGTCLQAGASSFATQEFSAFVKRKAGTGPIFITTDNGATWRDVSSGVDAVSGFVRVAEPGTSDPVFGFRLGTSGDEISVALAINANNNSGVAGEPMLRAPIPTHGASLTATVGDAFSFSDSVFSKKFSSGFSAYLDYYRGDGGRHYPNVINVRGDSDSTRLTFPTSGRGELYSETSKGTVGYQGVYVPEPGERVEVALTSESDRQSVSINGEPTVIIPGNGTPDVDTVDVAISGQMFLRRLLVVPVSVDVRDLRDWRYSGRTLNNLLSTEVVAISQEVDNTAMNREPTVLVLDESGDSVDVAVFWMQRRAGTYEHGEVPCRLMQRNYRYDVAERRFYPATGSHVIHTPPGWDDGLSHTQSPTVFVVPSGPYKGRLVMLFTQEDSPVGSIITSPNRSVHVMINDRGADPLGWSASTSIYDANANSYSYVITPPGGDVVILPHSHPAAPDRVIVPVYASSGKVFALYTDDFGGADGTNWLASSPTTLTTANVNEPTIAAKPDGEVVYTWRVADAPEDDRRVWATASDGITLVEKGLIPNYSGAEVAASTCQIDPSGVTGPNGIVAMSVSEYWAGIRARGGTKIDFTSLETLEFSQPIYPYSRYRMMGYTSLRPILGGKVLLLGVEGSSSKGALDSYTVYLNAISVE